MPTPEQGILLARLLNFIDDSDVVKWAERHFKEDDHSLISELASLPTTDKFGADKATALLREYVFELHPAFDLAGDASEQYAQALLETHCRGLLSGSVTPYGFCRVVSPIESYFDYPEWLGALANECDWCEPNSTIAEYEHLLDFARLYLEDRAV